MPAKILTIVGARPQFVKAAAVSREFATRESFHEVMVHTGQHFDDNMSAVFFRQLGIPAPAHNLSIAGGGHGQMTGRMLERLEQVMEQEQPNLVLVYGDTNSTLAGALAAAKLHIRVAHVEAGLRSFNRKMPEELNRIVTDHVSDFLYCPTRTAVRNLRNEGIVRGVAQVGDVMYDAALHARAASESESRILSELDLLGQEFSVATVHRAENTDSRANLESVFAYLRQLARDQSVVLPLHPRTRDAIERFGTDVTGLTICKPLGYLDMVKLVAHASRVVTDSGGLQKEAYFLRVPCVTLRNETEWVETVDCGWNRLWRTDEYAERREIGDYGAGRAAAAVVDEIAQAITSG